MQGISSAHCLFSGESFAVVSSGLIGDSTHRYSGQRAILPSGFVQVSEFSSFTPVDSICHLSLVDVEILPSQLCPGFEFPSRYLKPDPAGASHHIYSGATGYQLQPVATLRAYLWLRTSSHRPLLRGILTAVFLQRKSILICANFSYHRSFLTNFLPTALLKQ